MLAAAEQQNRRVQCVDDITSKEFPWSAVHQAREQASKYLRDLGMHEKADERDAVARYQVTPVDAKRILTNIAFERVGHVNWVTAH